MSSNSTNQYIPESVSLPGETLAEVLSTQGLSQAEFADRTGRPKKTINEIIKGKAAITPETALQFERVLGIEAAFWNNLEGNFREYIARREEEERLLAGRDLLADIPVATLMKRGWIKPQSTKVGRIREVLDYFGIASPEQWGPVFATPQASFRLSTKSTCKAGALAAWLRKGELEARRIETAVANEGKFRACLGELRSLTIQEPAEAMKQAVARCAEAGVAVAFVAHLPGCPVHGATRWLSPTKALIQLSFRYRTEDHLWFTFFHEAAHLLLHGKRDVFIDESGADGQKLEDEADKFASEFLLKSTSLEPLRSAGMKKRISKAQVIDLAQREGISPGIVVGRLQHMGWLPPSHLNNLRRPVVESALLESLAA